MNPWMLWLLSHRVHPEVVCVPVLFVEDTIALNFDKSRHYFTYLWPGIQPLVNVITEGRAEGQSERKERKRKEGMGKEGRKNERMYCEATALAPVVLFSVALWEQNRNERKRIKR